MIMVNIEIIFLFYHSTGKKSTKKYHHTAVFFCVVNRYVPFKRKRERQETNPTSLKIKNQEITGSS